MLIAKLYRIRERLDDQRRDRVADKDAGDVYLLMQAVLHEEISPRLDLLLSDDTARQSAEAAIEYLAELFGAWANPGTRMAVESLRTAVPAERVEEVCVSFVRRIREHRKAASQSEA